MIRSGISAAKGAACMTTKIGEKSQSNLELKPIQSPIPMPKNAEMTIPTTSGFNVSAYAVNMVPSKVSATNAAMDSKKVGKA